MARSADALSKMDILVLSSLARVPMHGYELKLELRYRHVRWWAKCEHGHLYATLQRLSKRKLLAEEGRRSTSEGRGGGRTVFRVTAEGKRRLLESLTQMGRAEDQTYFDIDLFLAGSYLLKKEDVVALLRRRHAGLLEQLAEALALKKAMGGDIPVAGRLIIEHRVDHLRREARFVENAAETIDAQATWGPFLGTERITDFIERTGVRLEG
jgi:DNA-binding PadR family transcriptional regulator